MTSLKDKIKEMRGNGEDIEPEEVSNLSYILSMPI